MSSNAYEDNWQTNEKIKKAPLLRDIYGIYRSMSWPMPCHIARKDVYSALYRDKFLAAMREINVYALPHSFSAKQARIPGKRRALQCMPPYGRNIKQKSPATAGPLQYMPHPCRGNIKQKSPAFAGLHVYKRYSILHVCSQISIKNRTKLRDTTAKRSEAWT